MQILMRNQCICKILTWSRSQLTGKFPSAIMFRLADIATDKYVLNRWYETDDWFVSETGGVVNPSEGTGCAN